MFIYKITVLPLNQCYIGFDTKEVYKQSRWKTHLKESKVNTKGKLHKAINLYGKEHCLYEVLEKDFSFSQILIHLMNIRLI